MRKAKNHGFCKSRIADRLRDPATPEVLVDFLSLVNVEVTLEQVEKWTALQRAQAEEWASQLHLAASDNAYIRMPQRPAFLPEVGGGGSNFAL